MCDVVSVRVCVCVSVVGVRALCVVHVAGQHVVVHVDGAAVVDGVAQPLGAAGRNRSGRWAGCRTAGETQWLVNLSPPRGF